MASLEIQRDRETIRHFRLSQDGTLIGRHPECDVVVGHETVSRRHARIVPEGDRYFLEDLQSSLGTKLNGRFVQSRMLLDDGDRIEIADTLLTFRAADSLLDDHAATILSSTDSSSVLDASGVADPREKLKALLELTASLAATIDLDELFPKILESALRIFPQADRGSIWLRGKGGDLEPRATLARGAHPPGAPPLSRTIAERVVRNCEAVLSADTGSDERFDSSASVMVHGLRSVMCAPLLSADRTASGMLQLDASSGIASFGEEDLDVLINVSNLAGQAVEYAQLHESRLDYERQQRDLSLARSVQSQFLPERPPQVPGFLIAHHYKPAQSVGGDYFDYIELPDGRVAIAIGDVAGKGVSAALLMARLCSDVRSLLLAANSPVDAVERLNRRVIEQAAFGRFVTLALCVLQPTTGSAVVVNAGHLPPLLRQGGRVEAFGDADAGPPLGVVPDANYRETPVEFAPGDALLLFTDGVPEARSLSEEMLGEDAAALALRAGGSADAVLAALLARVAEHTQGAAANDDLCAIAISREA